MKEIRDIIQEIGQEEKTNKKLAILKEHKDNLLLKEIFELAYNNKHVFRIKSNELPTTFTNMRTLFEAVQDIKESILGRKVIGNNARHFLEYTLGRMNKEDATIIHNMVNRDLKIGVAGTTANKVWKDLVPKQRQMLAQPSNKKTLSHIRYKEGAFAQLKADGARCFINVNYYGETNDLVIRMTTRDSNEYQDLKRIRDCVEAYFMRNLYSYTDSDGNFDVELDGELVVFNDGGHTKRSGSNGIMNKSVQGTITDEEQRSVKFLTWDLVNFSGPSIEYDDRLSNLIKLIEEVDDMFLYSPLQLIETTVVYSLDEAREVYRKYVDMGLEGIILKNRKSLWENRRSKNLVKFKEEIEVDLEVVGYTQITTGEEKLGSLQLRSSCGNIEVSCGSGFKDITRKRVNGNWQEIPLTERDELDRELLWSKRDELLGRIVQIKCNGLVKDKTKDIHSLYLPIFQLFRFDKSEANALTDVFEEE